MIALLFNFFYKILFFIIFKHTDAEQAHDRVVRITNKLLSYPFFTNTILKHVYIPSTKNKNLHTTLFNVKFTNILGVAAGLDKNATFNLLPYLGNAMIEMGTVTPEEQKGHDKPRIHRLIKEKSLVNNIGFANDGIDTIIKRIKILKKNKDINVPIGLNIGKSKDRNINTASKDYITCINIAYKYIDYIAINISSPNTEKLRELEHIDKLDNLLKTIYTYRKNNNINTPILLKISPDINLESIKDIVRLSLKYNISGIIATNSTVKYQNEYEHKGGLCGKLLKEQSYKILKELYKHTQGQISIISVGGIESIDDAWKRILAGANLLQGYASFIYKGPLWAYRINKKLSKRLGKRHINDVVGNDNK